MISPVDLRPLVQAGRQAGRELAELLERRERSPVISRWWLSSEAVVEGVGSGLELCNTSRWFGVAVCDVCYSLDVFLSPHAGLCPDPDGS